MNIEYTALRDSLRWRCQDDALFRDGADHFLIDKDRFDSAANTIGSLLEGAVVYDIGSYPGYGIWAFRKCRRYIGVGKSPDWFLKALPKAAGIEWLDWDIESSAPPRNLQNLHTS